MTNRFLNGVNPPDMDEAVKVYECADCGEDICSGDSYFEVDDEKYCRDCAEKRFEKIAEIGEFDGGIAFEEGVNWFSKMSGGGLNEM
jgi:DNA-directed RNA polymerase subunit RPC12/RpoP